MAGHITLEERELIAYRRAAGGSRRVIAGELGRSPSTISRALYEDVKIATRIHATIQSLRSSGEVPRIGSYLTGGSDGLSTPTAVASRATSSRNSFMSLRTLLFILAV